MKNLLAIFSVALAGCLGCEPVPRVQDPSVQGPTVAVTEANFEAQVLRSEQLVLVDFGAEWCGPCRAMEPVLDSVARKYAGQLVVAKVDVDEQSELAQQYQISAIPALLLFQHGELVERLVGGRSEAELTGVLQRHLPGGPVAR